MPVLDFSKVNGTPVFLLRLPLSTVKTVYGATYQGNSQRWMFPAFYPVYQYVIEDLRKVVKDFTLSDAAQQHLDSVADSVEIPQDFSFITKPYQHQLDGLLHLYRHLRGGLFYSPGLGKCKITVDLQRLTQGRMLILCPRVMLQTWVDEFQTHGKISSKHVVVIEGATKAKKLKQIEAAKEPDVVAVVVTYATAALYADNLLEVPYDSIIADESHQLKSPFSNRTKAAQALASKACRRVLLSGTPSLGSPFDLYAQLRFLGRYFCPEDWWRFRKVFGVFPEWEANEAVPKMVLGFKNLEIMNKRVNLVCLRKTKEECLDLPDQQVIDKKFSLYASQKKAYNSLIEDRADAAGFGVQQMIETNALDHRAGAVLPPHVLTPENVTLLNKLDQIASGFLYKTTKNPRFCDGCSNVTSCAEQGIQPYTNKCLFATESPANVTEVFEDNARSDLLEELLEELLQEQTNKVIIWANYTAELDAIAKLLDKNQYEFVRVEGGSSAGELKSAKDTFNSKQSCRVYLGQVSTGIGITLNAANYMVYYNLPWSLEHYLQSLDRNYRIGQTRKVTVYRLIAQHTLDESKAAALDKKMDFSHLVTTRSICATCPDFTKRCADAGIQLYDPLCMYDRKMLRETAKVRVIP